MQGYSGSTSNNNRQELDLNLTKIWHHNNQGKISLLVIHHSSCKCRVLLRDVFLFLRDGNGTRHVRESNWLYYQPQRPMSADCDWYGCADNCDFAGKYAAWVVAGNDFRKKCAFYGFTTNILGELGDNPEGYDLEDLVDIDCAVALLAMYCYRTNEGKCIALPFSNKKIERCKGLYDFYRSQSQVKISNIALTILDDTSDQRWNYARNMYRQLLWKIYPAKGSLEGAQKEIFDTALKAWEIETENASLSEPLIN